MSMSEDATNALRIHAGDALRRARAAPAGSGTRQDLRQLAIGLRWLERKGSFDARDRMAESLGPTTLPTLFGYRDDEALQETIASALAQCAADANPVHAAAAASASSLRLRPDCRPLALWLADAVLAHRLSWPAPVPLLAAHLTGAGWRHAVDDEEAWLQVCGLAYACAAAAAWDSYAELGHRADRLLAAAPKLRSKDADTMIATLLSEDAQPARGGQTASHRSSRRLFERLVALGVVRELTGRPTFRLYGL